MEQTECSETSAYKPQTPGNYPEENIQQYFGYCLKRLGKTVKTLNQKSQPMYRPIFETPTFPMQVRIIARVSV